MLKAPGCRLSTVIGFGGRVSPMHTCNGINSYAVGAHNFIKTFKSSVL